MIDTIMTWLLGSTVVPNAIITHLLGWLLLLNLYILGFLNKPAFWRRKNDRWVEKRFVPR